MTGQCEKSTPGRSGINREIRYETTWDTTLGHASHGVILEAVEERFARQPLAGLAPAPSRSGRSPADNPRHERLGGGAVEPLDLDMYPARNSMRHIVPTSFASGMRASRIDL